MARPHLLGRYVPLKPAELRPIATFSLRQRLLGERLLSPKAVTQKAVSVELRQAAIGQKRPNASSRFCEKERDPRQDVINRRPYNMGV